MAAYVYTGKTEWLPKHLPWALQPFLLCGHKHYLFWTEQVALWRLGIKHSAEEPRLQNTKPGAGIPNLQPHGCVTVNKLLIPSVP